MFWPEPDRSLYKSFAGFSIKSRNAGLLILYPGIKSAYCSVDGFVGAAAKCHLAVSKAHSDVQITDELGGISPTYKFATTPPGG
jgi:hypothetical protein